MHIVGALQGQASFKIQLHEHSLFRRPWQIVYASRTVVTISGVYKISYMGVLAPGEWKS